MSDALRVEVHVTRGAGHPWDSRPGFDILELRAKSEADLEAAVALAKGKFWLPWILGVDSDGSPAGALYKPSGIAGPWEDSPDKPHPGCNAGVILTTQLGLRN